MRKVVVFDFDGTLTRKDTLLEFIKYTKGMNRLLIGLYLYSPLLILMKCKLFPNWRAKQLLFSFFFKDMSYTQFKELGVKFAKEIDCFQNTDTLATTHQHLENGDTVYVISASIEEWVKPWCNLHGIENVAGTTIEVHNGRITGNFMSKNCYGKEKVNRLLDLEPDRSSYYLVAYGDSRGDKEIIDFADEGYYVH